MKDKEYYKRCLLQSATSFAAGKRYKKNWQVELVEKDKK